MPKPSLIEGRTFTRELDSARLRLEVAHKERRRTEEVIAVKQRRISLLEAQSLANPGHDFGDLTLLLRDVEAEELKRFSPRCVSCRAITSSEAAVDDCPGDTHACQAATEKGATPTAFQQYGRDGWLCGQPGSFNSAGTAWECTAGHCTDQPCGPGWSESTCLADCPCRDLSRKSR